MVHKREINTKYQCNEETVTVMWDYTFSINNFNLKTIFTAVER